MAEKITILLATDHTLVRESWTLMLNEDPRFDVIAQTGDEQGAVELAAELQPHVVILDINFRHLNNIEITGLIRQHSPSSKILAVSMHLNPGYLRKMMQSGATGCISKTSGSDEMFKAIIEIHEGREYICDEIKTALADIMINDNDKEEVPSLSKREIEVIHLIKHGKSSREIATHLNVATRTIEVHRYNIMKKLGSKNVASLINHINMHYLL